VKTVDGFARIILNDLGRARMRASAAALVCPAPDAIRATKTLRHGCHTALLTMTMPRATERGWSRKFDDPILLAKGRQLVTLMDAGDYITTLPKPSTWLQRGKLQWRR
jgi:hypothetical protein